MSGFALAEQVDISNGLSRLEEDLSKGHWAEKYAHVLTKSLSVNNNYLTECD